MRRDFFEVHQPLLPSDAIVCLDESGANTTFCRSHGRAPAGQRVRGRRPVNRGKNQTIIGAATRRGMLLHNVFEGAMTAARFLQWVVEKLVPKLRPGDIVLLDNLRAHHSPAAVAAIEAAGADVLYLPPYSPDLNPIEPAWSKLKAFLRKTAARTVTALHEALDAGMQTITPSDCTSWFKHCGWSN